MKNSSAKIYSPMRVLFSILLTSIFLRLSSSEFVLQAQEVEIAQDTTTAVLGIPFTEEGLEQVFDALERRETSLIEAEEKLQERRELLNRLNTEIVQKIADLEAVEGRLAATLALADAGAEQDIEKLADVYENMKPKDAAALFGVMTPNFAAGFLSRMQPEAAAAVMTELPPDVSHTISIVFAGRNANAFDEQP